MSEYSLDHSLIRGRSISSSNINQEVKRIHARSSSFNNNPLGQAVYYKMVNYLEDPQFIKDLNKRSPAGVVFFRTLLMFERPKNYLEYCIENEIIREETHQIFRDNSFNNIIINEYVKSQLKIDSIILPFLKKWSKGTLKVGSSDLYKRVESVVDDLFKVINILPQSIIYILNRTYILSLSNGKDSRKMIISLLFLGILMPLFLTNNGITSNRAKNNLVQICRTIQSVVNGIVNGTVNGIASDTSSNIKSVYERLNKMLLELTERLNLICFPKFAPLPYDHNDVTKTCVYLYNMMDDDNFLKKRLGNIIRINLLKHRSGEPDLELNDETLKLMKETPFY